MNTKAVSTISTNGLYEEVVHVYYGASDENSLDILKDQEALVKEGWVVKDKKSVPDAFRISSDCHVTYERKINQKGEDNMNAYKPFLEVVELMQNGDIADCEKSYVSSLIKDKNEIYKYDTKRNEIGDLMTIHDSWFKHNFKIRPRYVNFDEAKKAVDEGRTVEWFIGKESVCFLNSQYNFKSMVNMNETFGRNGFSSLFEGKFLIRED
ncbi:hypothetical protein [Priestia megaterium]|uniref:hypothetical protein n=1 Tax=Priestia megaterium TaxID=1404 RepID=UPI003CC67ECD